MTQRSAIHDMFTIGADASQLRSEGTAEMLDGLEKYLASQPAS